jgi:Leucine-rich repeat (LRR) protein
MTMKIQRLSRVGFVFGVLSVVAMLSGCPLDVVFFPDAGLDQAVREALDKPFGFITRADLRDLRELQAAGREIRNLEGLQYCDALTHLNLRSNRIQTISQLTDMSTLVWVDLGDNILRDIEPVSGLLELQFLNLFGAEQEIWDWQHLVANVTALGSALGDGGVVVLPTNTTLASDNQPLPSFQSYLNSMQSVNVQLIFADPGDAVEL